MCGTGVCPSSRETHSLLLLCFLGMNGTFKACDVGGDVKHWVGACGASTCIANRRWMLLTSAGLIMSFIPYISCQLQ